MSSARAAQFPFFGRRLATIVGALLAAFAVAPAAASAAECTTTWTGPAEGTWQTAGNWSTGKIPSSEDVVCIGSENTVKVTSGGQQAAIVQGEGDLQVVGASLTLTLPPSEGVSSISSFLLETTTNIASLTGVGTLNVSNSLTMVAGDMSGTGKTVLQPGATGELKSGTLRLFSGRTLVNEGTLTLASNAQIHHEKDGVVENLGTFYAESVNGLHSDQFSTGKFINAGTYRKTTTGTAAGYIDFENKGTVEATAGSFSFTKKGSSTSGSSWISAAGSPITFGANFTMASGTSYSGDFIVSGTNVVTANGGINDPEATFTVKGGGTLSVSGAPLKITKLALASGTLKLEGAEANSSIPTVTGEFIKTFNPSIQGTGNLEVTNSLTLASATNMTGTGKTILKSGATGEIKSGKVRLSPGRHFINNGTFTLAGGHIEAGNNVLIENTGTFNANSEDSPVIRKENFFTDKPLLVNTGKFQKMSGTGKTGIGIDFGNLGEIHEKSGQLAIEYPVAVDYKNEFGKRSKCGDPVDCATGDFAESQTDLAIGGRGIGLTLTRAYSARSAATASSVGAFGYGWTNSFGDRLVSEEGGKKITWMKGDGSTVPFTGGPGTFTPPNWSQDQLTGSAEAGYTLMTPDQTSHSFSGTGRLEDVTDRNGNKTTLSHDESGRLKEITDPVGRKITLAYNGEGTVKSAEDPMGNVVEYTYESKKLKSVTLPGEESPRWQFKYDGSRRVTEMIDGRGGKTTNVYDGSHRVISQTDPASRTLKFEYSAFHTKVTNEATGAITDQWFTSNNQPYSITRGYGTANATTETFTYNTAGYLLTATDGNGHTSSYTYDPNGNRKGAKDAEGNETKWVYNETHDVISMTTSGGKTTTIERDGNGNPESISRSGPEETTQTVTFSYDEYGRLESITDPLEGNWVFDHNVQGDRTAEIDPEGNKRSFEYDLNSRLKAVVSPRGNVEGAEPSDFTTSFDRDAQGRPLKVTNPLGEIVEYAYDDNGNVETETNGNGHTTTYFYNAVNEKTKVEKPNGAIRETSYDGAGNITNQTEPNEETTTYVRNIVGQPVEIIDPLGRKTIQKFDGIGNLKAVIDADERETSYIYDKANRLTKVAYSDGTTPNVEMTYDPDGNMTGMVDGSGEATFVYDELGRLTESQNGHGDTVDYDHNVGEQLVEITYPNGKSVSRAFDEVGRLEKVTDWLGGTTSFAYDADSNLEEIGFPAGTSNADQYGYDRVGRMDEVKFVKGSEPFAALSYIRDGAGQIEDENRTGLPGPEEVAYGYDENERLVEAAEGSFEYDAADNLTNAPGTTNTYDEASQLKTSTGVSYVYDNHGQRTEAAPSGGPATTYEYDQAGHLISIARPEEGAVPAISQNFAYDGSGLLTSQTSGLATRYLTWDLSGELPLVLNDDRNSYIYGPSGLPIAQISSGEVPTYLHHDQLGSTRLMTDSGGNATGTFSYSPYGTLEGSSGEAATPLGFAGQYTDAETGLQYLRARFYDPATAQFLTVDPLAGHTHTPYIYGNANPTTFIDPSGLGACVLGFIDCDETDDPCDSLASGPMLALCGLPEGASDPVSETAAGFGDGASFGLTKLAREGLGQSDPSDACSMLYNFSSQFGSLFRDFTLTVWGTPALRYFPIRIKPQVPRDLPPRYQNPPRDLDPVP